jgi:hypothetical protein
MNTVKLKWPVDSAGGPRMSFHPSRPWWRRGASALRPSLGVGFLAVLALLGLLLAFQQVVHNAVQQGESRRQAEAASNDALWRCNTARSRSERVDCVVQLNATHAVETTPQRATVAAPLALAPVGR